MIKFQKKKKENHLQYITFSIKIMCLLKSSKLFESLLEEKSQRIPTNRQASPPPRGPDHQVLDWAFMYDNT